jgi:hypothetical protein
MTFRAVINHKGALAHYCISPSHGENYLALLVRYDGRPKNNPPERFEFTIDNTYCSRIADKKILEQLRLIVTKKLRIERFSIN